MTERWTWWEQLRLALAVLVMPPKARRGLAEWQEASMSLIERSRAADDSMARLNATLGMGK